MGNTLLTPTAVTREALRVLHGKLRFVGSINRQYDSEFAKSGAKIGDSLKIRLPNQYTVRSGAVLQTQDTTESSVTLQVSTQKGVDLNFTSDELTLDLNSFSKQILSPAMAVLAAAIEADALSMRTSVYNQANNTAAAATFANVLNARRKMIDNLTPQDDDITCLLRTQDNADLVDVLKVLFHSSDSIKKQYRDGVMGHAAGMDFMETTYLNTQTRGSGDANYDVDTRTSALPIVATPVTSVTTITGTGTVAAGEIFTIAGVNRVHPETKADTGELQQFVSTAAQTAAGVWPISPSIILAGPAQNVTITGSATAAVVIAGTISVNYGQSLAYHKDAFAIAFADLVMPKGVDFAAREVFDGISMRIVRQYDINNDKFPCRLDVMYGYKPVRPQMACRLANLAGT